MQLISIKTIYILGISNLVFLVLVLFTCRCFVGTKFYIQLLQKPWFKKFYNFHCWFWRGFVLSVALHTTVAFLLFGIPLR